MRISSGDVKPRHGFTGVLKWARVASEPDYLCQPHTPVAATCCIWSVNCARLITISACLRAQRGTLTTSE
ncbi:hypothetical protein R3I94_004775 [Phoxinus phoxinus]